MAALTLFLMTRKGAAVLDAIASRWGSAVVSRVVGARDQAVEEDFYEEIKVRSAELGIPHVDRAEAPSLGAVEVAMAVGWRWLVRGPSRVIVLHDSLLPRYRGFAPLVSCLANGEGRIGVTALLANERYDEGDILAQAGVDISYPLKVAQAIDRLTPLYAEVAVQVAAQVVAGDALRGRPQDHGAATYSLWRDEEDYRIDWTRPAAWIRRFIDAVGPPYRGASSLLEDRVVRILDAGELPDVKIENRTPGKIIFLEEGQPVVVCGQGLLKLRRAVDEASGQPLFPLSKFRLRFR